MSEKAPPERPAISDNRGAVDNKELAPTEPSPGGTSTSEGPVGSPYPWDDIRHLRSPGVRGCLLCVPTADGILRTIEHWHSLPNYIENYGRGFRWGGCGWYAPEDKSDASTVGALAHAFLCDVLRNEAGITSGNRNGSGLSAQARTIR